MGTLMKERIFFSLGNLWILSFSIFSTFILSIPLFYFDISWENLTKISGLSSETLMKNYNILISYLLNPFKSHLKMPDFPSSLSALEHFAQVKWLFLLVILLTIILFYFFILWLKDYLYIYFYQDLIVLVSLPIVFILFTLLIGFDNFFIFFHKIFFRDDSWLFNPLTDPVINVLTENFFMYCFIIFLFIYELVFLFFIIKGRKRLKNGTKKKVQA
ncbi:MAG: TIGR01906 family membrane protein [Lactovum sp.]